MLANSVNPAQTAPVGAVLSGSALFALLSVLLDTSNGSQNNLVNFYVTSGVKSKYIWR